MQHRAACGIAVAALLSVLTCGLCTADLSQAAQSADNNGITFYPASTTTYTLVSSTPQPSTVWVPAPPATWSGQGWAASDPAAVAGTVTASGDAPTSAGYWHRTRRHRHQYVAMPGATTAGSSVQVTTPPDSSSDNMAAGSAVAAGQAGATRTFLPGKGWATIVWGQPGSTGAAAAPGMDQGGPGPAGAQPGTGPPGGWMGGMQPPQQPGMGSDPRLPGGTQPSSTPAIPMQSPIPAGSWGAGWGGRPGGPWSSSRPGGWPASSSPPQTPGAAGGGSEADGERPKWPWPGSPLSPGSSRPGAAGGGPTAGLGTIDEDDSSDGTTSPPAWVGAGPGPKGSSSTKPWAATPSPRPGSSIGEMMWPARLSSPRPQPTVVTGPSKTDPDRPWLNRASPAPSVRPGGSLLPPVRPSPSPPLGVRAPAGVGPGAAASTGPGSSAGSSAGEWDEGVGDDGSDDKVPPKKPSPTAAPTPTGRPQQGSGPSPGMGLGPPALGTAGRSPSPSPAKPGAPSAPAQPTSGMVGGSQPLRGSPAPGMVGGSAQPPPRPFVGEDPQAVGPGGAGPMGALDSPDDVDVDSSSTDDEDMDEEDAAASPPTPAAAAAAAAAGPKGPGVVSGGGLVVRPGSGAGSGVGGGALGPGAPGPGRGNATAATAAATAAAGPNKPGPMLQPGMGPGGPGARPGMGPGMGPGGPGVGPGGGPGMGPAGMGPGMGPGGPGMGQLPPLGGKKPGAAGAVSEAGPRAGNASSTGAAAAAPPTGFTLSPSIPQQPGKPATGMAAGSVVVPTAVGRDSTANLDPPSYLWEAKGATQTVLMGCALPFEGDHAIVGKAVHVALKMAIQDYGASLKVPVNINLTCFNTKCTDIPAFNAMRKLDSMNAVAVVGDICSAATVAAAGVAGEKQLPLISPASSSPQLTGMPYFFRTVPSDRYQGAAAASLAIQRNFKNIGMVYEEASYGHGLAFNFMATFTRDGGIVPVVIPFKKGSGDPAAAVAQLVEAKASKTNPLDAVYVSTNNITFFTGFLRAAAAAKLGLPVFSGDAMANPEVAAMLQDNLALLRPVVITAFAQGSQAFQKKFKQAAPGVQYDGNAAQGYDAMHTLLRAYMAAPAPKESEGLAQEIVKQKFEGVSGPIAFDSKGDLLPHDAVYVIARFDTASGDLILGPPVRLP